MSSPQEEQNSEIEVLASIYEGSFRQLSPNPPHHFEIDVKGHATDNPETAVTCTLFFKYSPKYPLEAPLFEIRRPIGLSDDQNFELVILISDVIQRSIGTVMIFDIVSEVQQKLDEFSDEAINQVKAQKEKNARLKSLAEAEAEKRVFSGTRVTVESFNNWNRNFMAEMKAKKEAEEEKNKKLPGGQTAVSVKRLTGREMFLRDNQFDDSDLTFLAQEGGEIVEVDEKLFVDIGDIDLDDLEDDELEAKDQPAAATT
ncbi:unnamed protein product [Mesocestoides corti]|uniref:RWD domain-containing protein n=1 Tax=Mesocestoides corti TaxID=53468 RepID=A0A0R3U8R2_MESCO|nr:unnamed protein product [Mesocestoides corti]